MYESSVVTDLNVIDSLDITTLQNWTITGGITAGAGFDVILGRVR